MLKAFIHNTSCSYFPFSLCSHWVIFSNYQVNKQYISEFLCINKSSSELSCEGKCYLKQQLKQTQDSQEP